MDIQARAPQSPELDLTAVEAELFGTPTSPASPASPASAAVAAPAHLLPEFLAFPEDLAAASEAVPDPTPDPGPDWSTAAVAAADSDPTARFPDVRQSLPWVGRRLDPEVEAAYFAVPPVPVEPTPSARRSDDPYAPPPPEAVIRPPGRWKRRRSLAVLWGTAIR